MRISDSVANYILELLNQAGGIAEIQRNELASSRESPTPLIICIIMSAFESFNRVMRIYPPPPRLLSTIYPCSGVKREVST